MTITENDSLLAESNDTEHPFLHQDMDNGSFTLKYNKKFSNHPDVPEVRLVALFRGIGSDVDLTFGYENATSELTQTDTAVIGTEKTFEVPIKASLQSPLVLMQETGSGKIHAQDMITFYEATK